MLRLGLSFALSRTRTGREHLLGKSKLLHGDCLSQLKKLKDNSVDSLVTDPPAGISFMGKAWDSDKGGSEQWISWMTEVMTECLRVLKPGAHALVWAIPRTSHWTATAVERSGFEVRDVVTHLFGQGFPKSLDISKAIDKAAGAAREKGALKFKGGSQLGVINDDSWKPKDVYDSAPATDDAKTWSGWGTALKPAAEFWILARKPLSEKTVASNVLKWGTGGINIDSCRIGTERRVKQAGELGKFSYGKMARNDSFTEATGRFPANLVLDEEAAQALDEQVGFLHGAGNKTTRKAGVGEKSNSVTKAFGAENGAPTVIHDRGGSASRFFYVAKVSSSERGKENKHPTVKPLKLMRYLCRLVTPQGGLILDPFTGSGSTGVAALQEGFKFIGIEREQEYIEIAERRLETVNA